MRACETGRADWHRADRAGQREERNAPPRAVLVVVGGDGADLADFRTSVAAANASARAWDTASFPIAVCALHRRRHM